MNVQKVAIYMLNHELTVRVIKEEIQFTIATQKFICLGINLTTEVKNLCSENYHTLVKEIIKDKKMRGYSWQTD